MFEARIWSRINSPTKGMRFLVWLHLEVSHASAVDAMSFTFSVGWLERQFDEKLVEPNSALGEAINYLLKRWRPMTLFLREPGARLRRPIGVSQFDFCDVEVLGSFFTDFLPRSSCCNRASVSN